MRGYCRAVAIGLTWAGNVASHLKVRSRSRLSLTSTTRRNECQSEIVLGSSESPWGSVAVEGILVFGRTIGNSLRISSEARSGRHRAGTYTARQHKWIASPYQTRVSFIRQLVTGWNRLGKRRRCLGTHRRIRLRKTTQEPCRQGQSRRTGDSRCLSRHAKSGACNRFARPRNNQKKRVVHDQLRHSADTICGVGATLLSNGCLAAALAAQTILASWVQILPGAPNNQGLEEM